MALTLLPLAVFCSGAILADVRTHRVPNFYNATFFVSGVCFSCAKGGLAGAIRSLEGAGLAAALLLVPFLLRMLGGGDLKFFAAAGAIVGSPVVVPGFLLGAAAGGLVAVGALWRSSKVQGVLRALVLVENGGWRLPGSGGSSLAAGIPYTIPLAAGLLVAASFHFVTGGA
jgi:prepilin peptidase CpaA